MLINNENFKIYNSDTEKTIIQRIAAKFKTTPYWLFITGKSREYFSDQDQITVVNILDELKTINFGSFNELEIRYEKWSGEIQDLAKMYIIFSDISDDPMMKKILLEEFFSDSGGTEFNWDFIENTLNNSQQIIDELNRNIYDNRKMSESKEEEFKKYNFNQETQTNIQTTDFLVENLVITLNIKTEEPIVLSHVFDSFPLEDNILFCKFKNFFKINLKYKNLFNNYEYDEDNSDFLIVFFHGNKNFRELIITEKSPREFTVDIDSPNGNIDPMDFLNTPYEIVSQEKVRIKGHFKIINQSFHRALFLDQIMNNTNFGNFYVNERFKVSKNFQKINFYFYALKTGPVTGVMSMEKDDIKIKLNKISSNTDYFISIFSSLFAQYKSSEKQLYNIYKQYIPTITLDKPIFLINKRTQGTLAQIEPSLFLPLYSRKCAKVPRIIEDEDTTGKVVMEFPIYNEGGLKPRKYVCDTTGSFIYPGLRRNTLPNNNIFKYIPCCYETNQEERKGSLWNAYFKGIKETNDKYEHVLYKTSRILPNDNIGILPSGIIKLLGKNANRKGVFLGPNSFIDCVARSLGINDDIMNKEKRMKFLKKIRSKLDYRVCIQENSDLDFHDWFYNVNMYFEPRRFFRSLEEYFKVNIYFFERNNIYVKNVQGEDLTFSKSQINNGILALPNIPEKGTYIDPKRFSRNIIVYVHMGGAIDNITIPHCEYIINENQENVEKVYRQMLLFSHKTFMKQTPKYQYLDPIGRVYKVEMEDGKEIFLEKRLAPMPIEIKTEKQTENKLQEYIYMKRLARIFVEFCIIKFRQSGFSSIKNFIEEFSVIKNGYIYDKIVPEYRLEYYDGIFLDENKKIIFDSEDTRKRIEYNMTKLIHFIPKRNLIYSYFEDNLDFSDFVVNGESFKEFAFGIKQGYCMNNFLKEIDNHSTIIMRNKTNIELNGFFSVHKNIEILPGDKIYIFSSIGFQSYVYGTQRIIVIFKINSETYFLVKLKSI